MASRKAINYDLDVNRLKQYYPNPKNYRNAWRDVKRFLYKNGFTSRQYSGVVSEKGMDAIEVQNIIEELSEELKWFQACVQKIDVTNVSTLYDLKMLLDAQ